MNKSWERHQWFQLLSCNYFENGFLQEVDYATCLYLTTLNQWSSDHNVSIHDDRVKLSIYVITVEK